MHISLLESNIIDHHGPFLQRAFVAMHAHRYGSQLLEDVSLEVQLHRPFGLVEVVELEFVRIETWRHAKRRRRIPRLEIGTLSASNEFESYVLGAFGKEPKRNELVTAHVVSHEFAVFLGLSEHLHIDSLPVVWYPQFVIEGSSNIVRSHSRGCGGRWI